MGDHTPSVSIGLPVYNGENYLASALESLLSQTFGDFELFISDNASTDGTEEICQFYASKDKRIRYHRNPSNVGGAENFNRLIWLGSGEFFKWAAHDDNCSPTFIERCREVLLDDPTVVLCYPRSVLIDDSGEAFGHYADGLHLMSSKPHERLRQFFQTQGLCHAIYGLIRTDHIRATGGEGIYSMADRVLLGKLALRGKMYELQDHLFQRRIHKRISTNIYSSELELAAWYSAELKGRILLPKWRRLVEYLIAIQQAPITFQDKLSCWKEISRFTLIPDRWKSLGAEAMAAARQALRPGGSDSGRDRLA